MPSPPPLRPTGLLLHCEGHFTHEGQPIRHSRLRALLERSVCYVDEEGVYVVQIGRFRGQIEVEDAPFFVRAFDVRSGELALSDGSCEPLDVSSLSEDADGVLYCRVKRTHRARFTHAAQSHLLSAIHFEGEVPILTLDAGPRALELRVESCDPSG